MTDGRFLLAVLGLALLCCAGMLAINWHAIVNMAFTDTDDALRYVEVKAFLAGQNWFDVSQHRVSPPFGTPMHWSRLVDLPIAGLMLLFEPLFGVPLGDRIAMTLVPLGVTVALFVMMALAVRRIGGDMLALVTAALLATSLSVLIQFRPLRIDHHDWQILMAAVTLWATFDTNPRRGGYIAGAAVAFWLDVSLESLPYAALFGSLYALRVVHRAAEWPRMTGFATALAGGSALLLIIVKGWPAASVPWCDAMSPPWLLPMIAIALLLPFASHMLGEHSPIRRFLAIAIAVLAGGFLFLGTGRQCLGGPFETLDPLVYHYWYARVLEGRPIWEQTGDVGAVVVAPALAGIVGCLLAIRRATDRRQFAIWVQVLFLSLGATAVAIMVIRAISVAHLFLLPGNAYLLILLWKRARAIISAPMRIVATVLLFLLAPLGTEMVALSFFPGNDSDTSGPHAHRSECVSASTLRGLTSLPEGTIFAPLDISPFLLAFTPHSVVATGHHRANLAMKQVILGFTENEAQAQATVMARNADYLAYCQDWAEVQRYAKARPDALINALNKNRPPSWLQPIPMRRGETIRVYRILYAPGAKRIATPFMQ
jgi:hypothetical protein